MKLQNIGKLAHKDIINEPDTPKAWLIFWATVILLLAVLVGNSFGNTKIKMIRPFVESEFPQWKITSKYETIRSDGGSGERIHYGVDYSMPTGTSVIAPYDGEIIVSKYMGNYGNVVFIDHGNGVQTRIAHLSEFVKLRGSKVKQGELIAYSGDTGNAKGRPHIHFETLANGKYRHPAGYIF
jgi:murein DD-endopeptidase MepM/ murein hydrolase activator NlpD